MSSISSNWKRKRLRYNLKKRQKIERPRLTVHRTNKHIYAQVIDDSKGITLASASSVGAEIAKTIKSGANIEAAKLIGKAVADRAIKSGVKDVYFDRSAFKYHGRIKELADAARQAGLEF